jgi:hypothetical protein
MAETQLDSQAAEHSAADHFLLDAAVAKSVEHMCKRCGNICAEVEAVQKSPNVKVCKRCHAAYITLVRNMGWPPPDFGVLSSDEQMAFWKACKESSPADSRLKYSDLRATLIKHVVLKKTHVSKAEEISEAKPLDVWVKSGWDKDRVLKFGKQIQHEVSGLLFEMPVFVKTKAVILEEVEDRITKTEQSVKQKASKEGVQEERLLEHASSDEEEPPPKKQAKGKADGGKDERAAQRKQDAEDKKHNRLTQNIATRVAALLSTQVADCKAAKQAAEKEKDNLPPHMVEDVVEVTTKLLKFHHDATILLKSVGSAAIKGGRLGELDFDIKQASMLCAETKATIRKFNVVCKALKI